MAGRIPQHFIDELLSRVDIVDVINQRVTLKKTGSNYSACCPFHSEKTPSFTVSQTKQFYHCFGCGVNGSAIGFLMEYDNMHFVDAIETLAETVGMEVPREQGAQQAHEDSRPLYTLMESIATFYRQQLRHAPDAIAYLKSRGLSGETAKHFGIGFAADGWDHLQKQFPGQEAALIKTGMLIAGGAGKRPYQRFRNRVMFPIRDRRGRVIGFGGRVMDGQEPKYLNSPETVLFKKASELYGLYEARKAAQEEGCAIVVEGYMDVVALAQHGIHNAVATLGTAANQQHSENLFKVVHTIIFCFDGDRAGRAAAWRAMQATLPCLNDGRDAHFLFLPDGEDPDSVVRQKGAAGFRDLMSRRLTIIDFLYQQLASGIDVSSIGGKSQLADKARPLVGTIPNGIYRTLAIRHLESLIGVPVDTPGRQPPPPVSRVNGSKARDSQLTPMRRAVLLCMQHPGVVQAVNPDDIDIDPSIRGADVLMRLIGYCESDPNTTTGKLLERFRDTEHHPALTQLASRPYWPDRRELDFDTAAKDFTDCISQLRRQSRKTMVNQVATQDRVGLLGMVKRH